MAEECKNYRTGASRQGNIAEKPESSVSGNDC
jgi:hypothetical protein